MTYSPTGDANEYRDTIWNNYPVRNSGELFLSNRKVATEQWTDDTFLRTTEKAADSNLLDGLNSTQFLRSDANDTKTGDTIFTGKVTLQTNLVITEDAPTISFLDTSSEDDFYIHVNSNNFYVLRNTANSENTVDGGWDSPHPLQLEGDTNKAYIFGNLIGTAAYQASSAFDASGTAQTIVDTAKEELLNGAIATAQTTADNAATAAANAQTTANTALARADGAREDTVAIGELATAAQAAADAAQATADSKLGATAKAADSNLLDGIDSSAFLRSNAADTFTGTLTMGTQKALVANNYGRGVYGIYSATRYQHVWSMGTAYNLADDGTGAGNLYGIAWTHQNIGGESISGLGHQMLIMSNGDARSAIGDGIWTKYNLEVGGTTYINNINTKNGTITNNKGSYLHLGGWAVGRTDASAVLVNTAYRADYATSLFDMNISRFTNNSGYITQGSVDALAEELRPQIEAAQSTADGKLDATAKAADSNLLDGVDSSRFVYGGNATKTTNVSNVSTALASGFYDSYQATGTPTNTWYTYINMRHNNTGNNYGSQIAVSFYSNADMFVRTISNGTYQGWSKIWNAANFDPASKANVSHDHNDLYYTKAQSNANYDAAGSAATAQSNAIGVAGDRIDNEVMPQVTTNATNIARNATEIAAKAAAGGSYGQDFAADDMRVDQWFRNTASGKGLYNEATTQHFYSDDDDYWNVAGGTAANGIRFRDEHAGTIRGYVYADNSNNVGFLDSDGNWGVRVVRDSHVEFRDNNEVTFTVGQGGHSSNYGTVCTHGTGRGNWEGYSINGWWVWMSSDGGDSGIYNDIDNEWATRWYRNGRTELHYNGSVKLQTTNGGVSVTGTVSATAFSGNGSGLTNLTIPDQRVPVTINGEENTKLASINMNLDRGLVEFTMDNGQTFTAQMGR